MNELITIKGVRGRINENGSPELNLEDVARGLGFTQVKRGAEYVRWETVIGYLRDFGFSQLVGKDDLPECIPENIFYKLCFKAKNAAAQLFQDRVTDEVLPAIRKHGTYMTPEVIEKTLTNPDFIIKMAQQLKEERIRVQALQPKAGRYDRFINSDGLISVEELSKVMAVKGMGTINLYKWLQENKIVYHRGRRYYPYQNHINAKRLAVREDVIDVKNKAISKSCIYFTKKGFDWIIGKLEA